MQMCCLSGLNTCISPWAGLFTVVLIFAINSILRGAGEARLAMIVLFVATAVTVVSEGVLVFGLGPFPALGVSGSAYGIVLGYGSGVVLQMVFLLSGGHRSVSA